MGRVLDFEYFDQDILRTRVHVDYEKQCVDVKNFTDDPVEQAFGKREADIALIDEFFRERVFPETRVDCRELLNKMGLKNFDAEAIARITHGILYHDTKWIRFDSENFSWEDVRKLRQFEAE